MSNMPSQDQKRRGVPGKALRYLRRRGMKEFVSHTVEKVRDRRFSYQQWILAQEPSSTGIGYQKKLQFYRMPDVAVMILRPETDADTDEQTLHSVQRQTYQKVAVSDILTTHISDDSFVLFVRNGDVLTRDAVFRMVEGLQAGADAVYADEDSFEQTDGEILYASPLFKPDYNPDYLRSCNYIGSPFMVRAGLARSLYREADSEEHEAWSAWSLSDPASYYDFILRCSLKAGQNGGIVHVPRILCHVKRTCGTGGSFPAGGNGSVSAQEQEKLRKVLEEDLVRRGLEGSVEDGPLPGTFHISYDVKEMPLVSIVIPNRDNQPVLENCIRSIREISDYPDYEIVIVENNSSEKETFDYYRKLEEEGIAKIICYEQPFHFSRVLNTGVDHASGEYVILMNNDVTVLTPDWIKRLLAQCQRPGIGAAGPKLLYPDGRVQSAGIVAGIMGFAGSIMVLEDGDDPGYMGRGCLTQNMSALTAACLMVRRSVYQEMEGFADDLPVALNDVDFCLKLVRAGYRNVFEPAVRMIHHESLSRGSDETAGNRRRFETEKAVFRKRWAEFLKEGDPAYNPNLSKRRCDWSQQT